MRELDHSMSSRADDDNYVGTPLPSTAVAGGEQQQLTGINKDKSQFAFVGYELG